MKRKDNVVHMEFWREDRKKGGDGRAVPPNYETYIAQMVALYSARVMDDFGGIDCDKLIGFLAAVRKSYEELTSNDPPPRTRA